MFGSAWKWEASPGVLSPFRGPQGYVHISAVKIPKCFGFFPAQALTQQVCAKEASPVVVWVHGPFQADAPYTHMHTDNNQSLHSVKNGEDLDGLEGPHLLVERVCIQSLAQENQTQFFNQVFLAET